MKQLAMLGLAPTCATSNGFQYFDRPRELGYTPGGEIFRRDCLLPWPYCPPIRVVWRNGIGMPVEFIPK